MTNHANRILLIQRGKEPGLGKWALPGGGVEMGESVIMAGLRELYEETGLYASPQDVTIVGTSEFIQDGWHKFHVILEVMNAYGHVRHGTDATATSWNNVRDVWKDESVLEYTKRLIRMGVPE